MAMASYFKPSPYDVNWLTNRDMGRFLDGLSKTETFDLVQVESIGMYPYASAFNETPIVLDHHNVESHMMRRRYEKEAMGISKIYFHREAAKLKRWEQSVCGKCAVNLVVSELDGIRLKENAGDIGSPLFQTAWIFNTSTPTSRLENEGKD